MRDLFGGAIVVNVPPDYTDVSMLRQIPDNQEVFARADSDCSFIFELLESVPDVASTDAAPALFHWNNLAVESEASESEVNHSRDVPVSLLSREFASGEVEAHASVATGFQRVAKFRDTQDAANIVRVSLACLRLPKVTTDFLIVFNEPLVLHADSASKKVGCSVDPAASTTADDVPITLLETLSTLAVHDWSLFG
jgi:Ran-interacting Mog1 protein